MSGRCRLQTLLALSAVFLLFLANVTNALPYNLSLAAQSDQVTNLPGLVYTPTFRHFAGYLQGADSNKQLFYWFFESQSRPEVDPLVLWLNGGPGCSSLMGATSENGPFTLNRKTGKLTENIYSWNKKANVLYIEAPAGVGYSYFLDKEYVSNDDNTSKNNLAALKSFMTKFPQYKTHDFFITGESYSGVYIPTLAKRVLQDGKLKLKAVAIGNGLSNYDKNENSMLYFAYNHGLVSTRLWQKMKKACCRNQPADRCQFTKSQSMMCQYFVSKVETRINNGLNIYNLYGPCVDGVDNYTDEELSQADITDDEESEVEKLLATGDFTAVYSRFAQLNIAPRPKDAENMFRKNVFVNYQRMMRNSTKKLSNSNTPCTDSTYMSNYFNDAKVKQALHVRSDSHTWAQCSDTVFDRYGRTYTDMSEHYKYLLQRKIPMLIYNGDVDMACNYLGDEWFLDDLGMKLKSKYRPWFYEDDNQWKQVGGWTKQWTKFQTLVTFATVRGSGHMVPTDKPEAALRMFTRFLAGKNL